MRLQIEQSAMPESETITTQGMSGVQALEMDVPENKTGTSG